MPTNYLTTSWPDRAIKALKRLRAGDLPGLGKDVADFVAWQQARLRVALPVLNRRVHRLGESAYWDQSDTALVRRASWGSAADFGSWALEKMVGRRTSIMDIVIDLSQDRHVRPRRGLVLGCGDMVGEHWMFLDPRLPFDEIDAYDLSPASLEQARALTESKGLRVHYEIRDANSIDLPPNRYALIVVSHSYHHFERVDRVAQQINCALAPGGVFYTMDYIGPRRLQFTSRQLIYAQHFLSLLPPEKRRLLDGTVREVVASMPLELMSPDEAIRSDLILDAFNRRLAVRWQYNFAGLLYPLLDGIAFNFTQDEHDQALMRFLFGVDYALCSSKEIEPNFTFTIAKKKA